MKRKEMWRSSSDDSSVVVLGERSKRRFWSRCHATCNISSNPAETIATNDELLTEILVRVPVRSLYRFKSVSTHWESLISDPDFCQRHTRRNPMPITGAFAGGDFSFLRLPLGHGGSSPISSCRNLYDGMMIIHSCNGLLLLTDTDTNKEYCTLYVLNPATKKMSTLRVPQADVTINIGCILVFDPSKSLHHKVVCFHTLTIMAEVFHIQVYSSETRSWRLLESSFERKLDIRRTFYHGEYLNGAIHWLNMQYGDITYYLIDEERFGFIEGPPQLLQRDPDDIMCRYFEKSSCGSHLQLIYIYKPCITKFQVFEMPRDYSGWYVKYDVELDPICIGIDSTCARIDILFLDENEEEGSSSLMLQVSDEYVSYNLKSKSFKAFELPDSRKMFGEYCYLYSEILAHL